MKSILLISLSIVLFNLPALCQTEGEAPIAILEQSDIEKYAETIYPMAKEFEELGLKMEGKEQNPGAEWAANAEGRAILAKYGWDENKFSKKFAAITWGYTYLMMKKEIDKLPEEQKVQVEAMMPMMSIYENMVHKDDLSLVESNMEILDPAFKKLETL